MILINHASAPTRKERLSATSKSRREASRNEFVKNGRVPDKVESREFDGSNKPKAEVFVFAGRKQIYLNCNFDEKQEVLPFFYA